MPALTKDQILGAVDLKIERVDTPEWGEGSYVHVRTLNAWERDSFEASLVEFRDGAVKPKIDKYRPRLCALTICNEKGERLFTNDEDLLRLGQKNAAVLDRIADVAATLSGLNENALKEAAKKLKNAPPADSPSA